MDVGEFVTQQLELLSVEKEAEVEENRKLLENISPKELQRRGVCLLKLRVGSRSTELYGRTVLSFEPFWPGKDLPSHKLGSGDIVGVSASQDHKVILKSGVVTKTTPNHVNVAFEEGTEELGLDDNVQYQLVKLANDVTYRRIKSNLKDLRNVRGERTSHLIDVLFGSAKLSDPLPIAVDGSSFSFFNQDLDDSQKGAVKFSLCQKEVAVVHGPPGTGKTTTVVEIILQAVKMGQKVLACAPSNVAVDNLVERLSWYNTSVVRLGHPARLLPTIQQFALDAILSASDHGKLIEDVRKDIDKAVSGLRNANRREGKQKLRSEARNLRQELRTRAAKATKEVLQKSSVVLATLTSAYRDGPLKHLVKEHFDLVVIDECSQGLESACWIPLLLAPKCVLAGDHLQLPPTIVSQDAAKRGLEITLMERIISLFGEQVVRMLTMQYRMHDDIMQWSSNQLYKGKLTAHSSVASHLLRDMSGVQDTDDTISPLVMIDTAGCDLYELELEDEASKGNEGEADLVAIHVTNLIEQGVKPQDIGVITPYNLQVELLRLRLLPRFPGLEIKSVDGFQGREKEAIVISLVRSNQAGEVGFLADIRRMNVAVTRARRHLALIGDSDTISRNDELKTLVDYMNGKADIRSAHQYSADLSKSESHRPEHLEFKTATKKKPQPGSKVSKKSEYIASAGSSAVPKGEHNTIVTLECKREKQIEDKILLQVETFLKDRQAASYAFPCTLSSFERRIVHEIAEKKNLLHTSEGDGDERHIIITKPQYKPPMLESEAMSSKLPESETSDVAEISSSEESNDDDYGTTSVDNQVDVNKTDTKVSSTDVVCEYCQRTVPKTNYQLHTLHCSQQKDNKSNVTGSGASKKKTKPSVKRKDEMAGVDPSDFDAVIAAAVKANKTCHFPKCKTGTILLGQVCEFCNQRFCLSHMIPEVHGCGEEARIHARQTVLREGVVHAGSGVPSKKPDVVKRAHLERKLGKKLSDLASQRKSKKKE